MIFASYLTPDEGWWGGVQIEHIVGGVLAAEITQSVDFMGFFLSRGG